MTPNRALQPKATACRLWASISFWPKAVNPLPSAELYVRHRTGTAVANLDLIFASYPAEGFQDVWFNALEPNEVERLFNYACQTYGHAAPCAVWVQPTDRELGIYFGASELRNVDYEFTPLLVGSTVLEDVVIRIEEDRLAIDFSGGLDYWNSTRQAAFVHWLRELYRQVPNARLEWAHEGCANSPSEHESALLRLAVVGDA